ncbi:MAG: metallophosphoesterase [archaeon]
MKILKDIEIIDLALYLKKEKILVIGDVHIGYEEALNKQGILIPRFQFNEILKRLDKIFDKVKPEIIVVNGDLKHEFGTISDQEWRQTLKIIDYLSEKAKLILIKGNHDTILGPIANKRDIQIRDFYKIGDIIILHGNKLIKDLGKIIVIGHEHPAITFKGRDDKFKCFLKGKYEKSDLIVMPSFTQIVEGSDVLKEKLLSPYLKNINNFEVYVVEDKIYYFGKIKYLR